MRKLVIILAALISLTVTVSILTIDVPVRKPVVFSTKELNITNKNANIITQVKSLYTKLNFTNINDIAFKSETPTIENKNINNYQNLQVKEDVKNFDTTAQNTSINTNTNIDTNANTNVNINNNNTGYNLNNNVQDVPHGEVPITISWNQWRSNIINKILEDSYNIPQLNKYASGTWFYYNFNVDNEGNVSNVEVISLNMDSQDLQLIKMLIESYSHTPLIAFPSDSKRNIIKINAICLFDNESQGTQASDFHDFEKVDLKY